MHIDDIAKIKSQYEEKLKIQINLYKIVTPSTSK